MQLELRFDRWFLPLSVPLGLGPKNSALRVEAGNLHVKMGWAFSAEIPLASIKVPSRPTLVCTRPECTMDLAGGWSTGRSGVWSS